MVNNQLIPGRGGIGEGLPLDSLEDLDEKNFL